MNKTRRKELVEIQEEIKSFKKKAEALKEKVEKLKDKIEAVSGGCCRGDLSLEVWASLYRYRALFREGRGDRINASSVDGLLGQSAF